MFAEHWQQDEEIRKLFYQRIKEVIEAKKQKEINDMYDSLPSILALLARHFADIRFDVNQLEHENQGNSGEETISNTLWFWLPGNYRYFDDAVLEPMENSFIQLDHIVVAPQGIFLVETKTWNGAIFANPNAWLIKKKGGWVKIGNPVKQNERHARLFKKWLRDNVPDKGFLQDIVYPVVALKSVNWFKADESIEMPIVSGGLELVSYIKSVSGKFISDELGKEICTKIAHAEPYKEKAEPNVNEGVTKSGKKFVRVKPNLDYAQKVCKSYNEKGYVTSQIYQDKKEKDVYFFYIEKNE